MTTFAASVTLIRDSARPRRVDRPRIGHLLVSLAICTTVTAVFWAIEPRIRHWFVVPVLICGTLVCADALPWLRGKRDLFDPPSILAVLGVHFFFIAPLLHVQWDYWMAFIAPPPDWRTWLGWMAVLNVIGLLIYQALNNSLYTCRLSRGTLWSRELRRLRFFTVATLLIAASCILQTGIYVNSGGIGGYMEAAGSGPDAFAGMGWLFVLSESAPILAMMVYAVAAERNSFLRRLPVLTLALTIFAALTLLFGGLRGSRSNTVWAIFWAAGIIHYKVRPLSRKAAALGAVSLLCFMYFYGFYKSARYEDAMRAIYSSSDRLELEDKTGRTSASLLLGDLGRTDVQAFELYQLMATDDGYAYGWGRTYLGDLAILVPATLWPNRPLSKVVEGTNLLFGVDSFRKGTLAASNVYGVAGELMLNYGPLAVPLAFVILAWCVRRVDAAVKSWLPSDARWLIAPALINGCFIVLIGDLDNVVFFCVKNLLLPVLLLWATTKTVRRRDTSDDWAIRPSTARVPFPA